VKSNQSEVQRVLEAKGLKFEMVDIAANDEHRQNMRKLSGNPTAMPPQLFNENAYCGVSGFDFSLNPQSDQYC
ncbi:unnamed protein product, partial [Lampetra planeri]